MYRSVRCFDVVACRSSWFSRSGVVRLIYILVVMVRILRIWSEKVNVRRVQLLIQLICKVHLPSSLATH